MSTRNFPGDEGRQTLKADNLTAIRELIEKRGIVHISQPYWLPLTLRRILLLYYYYYYYYYYCCYYYYYYYHHYQSVI
jgi:8-oxo-dGTP pyrophosphatase MutT (NUDIX family)